MNRRSYVVALVALVALAGTLVWRGGIRLVSANTIQPDPASLALLPPQTTSVFGVDIDGLRSTALYNAWRQRAAQKSHHRDYNDFVARTGFDPERDLRSVIAGAWMAGDEPAFLAVVKASYSPAALASFLKEKGATAEAYQGIELLYPEHHGPQKHGLVLALLDGTTMLAGSDTGVKQALDQRGTGAPGSGAQPSPALLARVHTVGAENQVWAVSTAPGSFLPAHVPQAGRANLARVLKGLEGSTFAINAAPDLKLLAEGTCANENDARTLADAARGILAMLRLAAPADRPEALEVLNSFTVEQQDREVKVTALVRAQLLDQFASHPELFVPHRLPKHKD